jgi:transcriptional regulator with XRE-family HTH domain
METGNVNQTFGQRVRELREQQKLGIREFAKRVSVSATYVSQIERGQTKPTEERVFAIAQALGENEDEMLALAGYIAADIQKLLFELPKERTALVLATENLSKEQIQELARVANEMPKQRRRRR